MSFVPTYFGYLFRRNLAGVIGLFCVIWLLVISIDLIEAMREVGKARDAGLYDAVQMTLFRTPALILTLSPFIFLFGTMWAFGQMARSSEIAVMRSAGLSIWRLTLPSITLAVLIGLLNVSILDPISANLASRAQTIKNEIRGKESNMLPAFKDGIWLRQTQGDVSAVINARHFNAEKDRLVEVTVWRRTREGSFLDRWDAPVAYVYPDRFELQNTIVTSPVRNNLEPDGVRVLRTSVDLQALREDVARPESLSVYRLKPFSEVMSSAGMSTIAYDLRYQNLLTLPLKLAAMALIACTFALSLRSRGGGTAKILAIGIAAGFLLFIMSEVSSAMAEARMVPLAFAVWTPPLLAVLFAVTVLLYREDG